MAEPPMPAMSTSLNALPGGQAQAQSLLVGVLQLAGQVFDLVQVVLLVDVCEMR